MAGTDSSEAVVSGGPVVILVKPQMAENIGAAARAMLNFGLGELRLVAPRDGWPNPDARAMASRADAVLDGARVFERTEEAIADLQAVFATTARRRDMVKTLQTPRRAAEQARGLINGGARVGLMFGGERAGLDNDDVALASHLVHIPANPAFSSLNLAQAVLLLGYEWFQSGHEGPAESVSANDTRPATAEELLTFFGRLEAALEEGGFFHVAEMRPIMQRNVRNIFQRAGLMEQEVRTLHGVVSALVRGRFRGRAEAASSADGSDPDSLESGR